MNMSGKIASFIMTLSLGGLLACTNTWDDHYDESPLTSAEGIELYTGSTVDYLHAQPELSAICHLFDSAGITKKLSPNNDYTLIVYPNEIFQSSDYADSLKYAQYCISDVAIPPSKLRDGLGLRTWLNKVIWFNQQQDQFLLDQYAIEKVVKTDNAYLYYIREGVIPIRPSVYDILNDLGNDYSIFKRLVKQYEEIYFDPDVNTPAGTNSAGHTIYKDSIWSTRNTLMDRFTSEGAAIWNMRSDDYATTMLVPSNEVIQAAIDTALKKIPIWLGRAATTDDRTKFEKWLVFAC
jgi:hypothetical protein